MKSILNVFVVSLLSIASASAEEMVQYIDCRFMDINNTDRVIVSLKDTQNGTLFYTTGFDDYGNDSNTGKLTLKRTEDLKTEKDYAQFSSVWETERNGSPVSVEFKFSMPKKLIFKSSDDVSAKLSISVPREDGSVSSSLQGLDCFTRLYPVEKK